MLKYKILTEYNPLHFNDPTEFCGHGFLLVGPKSLFFTFEIIWFYL
jgi:hypothetical protein